MAYRVLAGTRLPARGGRPRRPRRHRAAESSLEHALDLAEPNGALSPFLLTPAPALLARHAGTAPPTPPSSPRSSAACRRGPTSPPTGPRPVHEPLSESELRVLRYLPTNLTGRRSPANCTSRANTIKTHMRNLYAKLGTHRRAEAVTRARALACSHPGANRRPVSGSPGGCGKQCPRPPPSASFTLSCDRCSVRSLIALFGACSRM